VLALLAAFIAIERRSQAPLMRPSIPRVRSLIVGDAAPLCIFGMFFFASLYVQDILGYRLPALLLRRRHTSQVDGQIAQPDVGQLDRSATATGATASSGVGPNRRATI
jgi:hypothetical protein